MKSPTGFFMSNFEEVRLDPFYKETDFDFELEFILRWIRIRISDLRLQKHYLFL